MSEPTIITIRKGKEVLHRQPATLQDSDVLTIGQAFNAVADFYGKIRDEYPRWISYSKHPGEFAVFKGRIDECTNDLEKIHLVCDWLGEERI